jgi:hypothetical protein
MDMSEMLQRSTNDTSHASLMLHLPPMVDQDTYQERVVITSMTT